jgi:hypothetical protein
VAVDPRLLPRKPEQPPFDRPSLCLVHRARTSRSAGALQRLTPLQPMSIRGGCSVGAASCRFDVGRSSSPGDETQPAWTPFGVFTPELKETGHRVAAPLMEAASHVARLRPGFPTHLRAKLPVSAAPYRFRASRDGTGRRSATQKLSGVSLPGPCSASVLPRPPRFDLTFRRPR